jgi:hypothetical protein
MLPPAEDADKERPHNQSNFSNFLVPWYEPVGSLVYLMAVGLAATVAIRLYPALKVLHSWALGRWLARCVTGSVAMVGFVAVFVGSGYGSLLSRTRDNVAWSHGVVLGVVMGIAYLDHRV